MNTVVIASSEQDAAAVEAVKQHHAQMAGALSALAGRVAAAATEAAALEARDELVRWAENDLVPHAKAEEAAMYPLAHQDTRARLLVDAMLVEHELIVGLVKTLREAAGQVQAAAEARALAVTFESHLAKENDQILPLLAESPGVSLSDALAGMHELLGGHDSHESHEECAALRVRWGLLRAARSTAPSCPSSTPDPCRMPSGTPPSSAHWTRCGPVAAWSWWPRTTRSRC